MKFALRELLKEVDWSEKESIDWPAVLRSELTCFSDEEMIALCTVVGVVADEVNQHVTEREMP